MATIKNNFNWRTSPRSITELFKWLPYFNKFNDQDYGQSVDVDPDYQGYLKNTRIYPVRRAITYTYEVNSDNPDKFTEIPFDEFVRGKQPVGDTADKESRVRQRVTTAEQYGLMDSKNAHLTPMGLKVVNKTFTAEDFLIQLLKMYVVTNPSDGVFPLKTVLKLIQKYKYLSRNELTYVFGVLKDDDYSTAEDAVGDFRHEYRQLSNKNDNNRVFQLVSEMWNKYFTEIPTKKLVSIHNDYTDALRRALEYTDLFISHGRGTATKIRISELNHDKVKMLLTEYNWPKPPLVNNKQEGSRNNIDWFGAIDNIKLPWDNPEQRKALITAKIKVTKDKFKKIPNASFNESEANDLLEKTNTDSINSLKEIDSAVDMVITNANEENFVKQTSQTTDMRQEIIERYDTILTDNDMSALWLEVNTWRAFVALPGMNKRVKYNFKMNPDLTPRSFAPGVGNTPDMEVYYDDSLILPEVSLMTGVQQWEHEASSVTDHILQKVSEYKDKNVIGLFISSKMNQRTIWQYFLLNRESWLGKPIPVVPITITQFQKIIKYAYENNKDIYKVAELIFSISEVTQHLTSYTDWQTNITNLIYKWTETKPKTPKN